jgi:hypothetical protein
MLLLRIDLFFPLRGFGSKILKQSGWKQGQGLGKRGSGIPLALGQFQLAVGRLSVPGKCL